MNKILPGKTIGILGGGQLGRMLCIEAAKLGYKTITFCPKSDEEIPASQVSSKTIIADYEDKPKLREFAKECDVITFEFENIPSESVKFLEDTTKVAPNHNAIFIGQNRLREREFFKQNNLPTHKYAYVSNGSDIAKFMENNSLEKAIMKTANFGYDGKGQIRLTNQDDYENTWQKSGFEKAIIEEFISFEKEISVIIARGENGETKTFPIGQNIHKNGILKESILPANIADKTKELAFETAEKIANLLNYVGVLAVEFFVLDDGDIYINEIAPRVHNSGHWSLDGCVTNQFEQHIRAICGLSLGDTDLTVDKIVMQNIIGDDVKLLDEYYSKPNHKIHNYAKTKVKAGRKLAHVNIIN